MGTTSNKEPFTRWHQEPWVWFIIGIVASSMIWGSFQLKTAFQNADSVVVDDYYKNGKAINEDLTREHNAKALAISAKLLIDDLTGEVRVSVYGQFHEHPQQLKLSLLSPVFASDDRIITLNRSVSDEYVGQLQKQASGRYYIQLETPDELIPEVGYETGWRINKKVVLTPGSEVTL